MSIESQPIKVVVDVHVVVFVTAVVVSVVIIVGTRYLTLKFVKNWAEKLLLLLIPETYI